MSNSAPQDPSTIHSVSEYMRRLEDLSVQDKHTLFFRGSANHEWTNEPSIFRNPKLIENEDHLYYDTLARCSDNFKHCDNTFENLVMMQHYGIPTRLLDITENPLVALYFACSGSENTDAKVDIFQVGNTEIKRYDSDTVAMLANVVRMPNNFDLVNIKYVCSMDKMASIDRTLGVNRITNSNIFLEETKNRLSFACAQIQLEINKLPEKQQDFSFLKKYVNELLEMRNKINNYFDEMYSTSNFKKRHDKADFLFEVVAFVKNDGLFGYEKYHSILRKLIHFIQSEKPYFNGDLIQLNDLNQVICVKPKQDNPHIIRQSGAFFLFGLDKNALSKNAVSEGNLIKDMQDKSTPAQIPNKYYMQHNRKIVNIYIPKAAKPKIINQLKALAISEGTLFTDIEKVAADLKKTYGE